MKDEDSLGRVGDRDSGNQPGVSVDLAHERSRGQSWDMVLRIGEKSATGGIGIQRIALEDKLKWNEYVDWVVYAERKDKTGPTAGAIRPDRF